MTDHDHVEVTLARIGDRVPEATRSGLREILQRERWAMWCTLYVDASNAGGKPGEPAAWGWGARGRLHDEVAALLDVPAYRTLQGASPEAVGADSGVGELWGIVHAVAQTLDRWPWLVGMGVRCDNLEAATAVGVCCPRGWPLEAHRKNLKHWLRRNPKIRQTAIAAAQLRLAEVAHPIGLYLRGVHVRGHGRADMGRQRAFNRDADRLARAAATSANRPRRDA